MGDRSPIISKKLNKNFFLGKNLYSLTLQYGNFVLLTYQEFSPGRRKRHFLDKIGIFLNQNHHCSVSQKIFSCYATFPTVNKRKFWVMIGKI